MPSESSRSVVPLTLILLAGLSVSGQAALAAVGVGVGTPVACPLRGTGTASVADGFYVTNYPGTNISRVTLGYTATSAELYSISLTAHRNRYDGPVLGSPQTATVMVPTSGEAVVTFDFGGAPVSPGDTIAFTQEFSILGTEGASLLYDLGLGTCGGLFVTQGTTPPLGEAVINHTVGVTITQLALDPQHCIPSDTVLCLDGQPGDHRFQVTATFQTREGGGLSGSGQAFPLRDRGDSHGGLFWFFDPDNPELLVKVLDGCFVNDRFWVFVTGGTNVGFSVTVSDTFLANRTKTYTHADLTAALPVEDTAALASCHPCASDADCRSGLLCCSFTGHTSCQPPQPGGGCPLLP
jgi:hypothetical protein